jgi:hypothetical protein
MHPFLRLALLLLLPASAATETWFIPAAAHAAGAEGTNWRTEAVFVNPGAEPVCADLFFLEAGRDNAAAAAHPIEVLPGRSVAIADLVGGFFASPGTAGAVRVEADGFLAVTTRTFNDLGEAGTYGQGIPAVAAGPAGSWPPWERYLPNLVSDDRRRTNLGFVNASASPLYLTLDIRRADGSGEWTISLDLAPYEYRQWNDPLRDLGLAPVGDAYAFVTPRADTDRFLAWASTVDRATGDAVFVLGESPGAYGVLEQKPWAASFGLLGDEVVHAIAPRPDGTVVFAGETASAGAGGSDILVEEYRCPWDLDQTLYGGPGDDKVFAAVPLGDGTTLLDGGTTSLGRWDAWSMKYRRYGEADWAVTVGTPGDEWAYGSIEAPDGTLVACGEVVDDGTGDTDGWVLALDPGGAPLWQFRYGGAREDWTYAIVPAPGGGALVAGGSRSFGPGDWDGWLLRIGAAGEILWSKAYGGPGDEVFYGLSALADGTFVASGQTSSWGAGGSDAWFVRVDGEGAVLWERAVGSLDDDTIYASATLDDGIVAAGQRGFYGPGDGEAWLVRLDGGGERVWAKETRESAPERLYAVAVGSRGRIFAGGRTSSSGAGGKDALTLQVDLGGSPGWDAAYPPRECPYLADSGVSSAVTDATVRTVGPARGPTAAVAAPAPFVQTPAGLEGQPLCRNDGPQYRYAVPGAAHAPGANGTQWKTDVQLATPMGTATTGYLAFEYLRAGRDNTGHDSDLFWLYWGGNFVYQDVLWTLFDETAGYGTLWLTTEEPAVPVASTYTVAEGGGSYGFAFAALPADRALSMGERGLLPGLTRTAGYRTNLGLSNDARIPITVEVEVRGAEGTALGSFTVDLRPLEPLQIDDLLGRLGAAEVADAYAVVSTATPFASLFAYASVVDNRTGDPVFIPAIGVP